jgi:hypothetical protein
VGAVGSFCVHFPKAGGQHGNSSPRNFVLYQRLIFTEWLHQLSQLCIVDTVIVRIQRLESRIR